MPGWDLKEGGGDDEGDGGESGEQAGIGTGLATVRTVRSKLLELFCLETWRPSTGEMGRNKTSGQLVSLIIESVGRAAFRNDISEESRKSVRTRFV